MLAFKVPDTSTQGVLFFHRPGKLILICLEIVCHSCLQTVLSIRHLPLKTSFWGDLQFWPLNAFLLLCICLCLERLSLQSAIELDVCSLLCGCVHEDSDFVIEM